MYNNAKLQIANTLYNKTHHEADEEANGWEKMPDVMTIVELEQQALFIAHSWHRWWNLSTALTYNW